MGLLTIDEGLCKKDELCVADCPTAILRIDEGMGIPQMVPGGEAMCLRCGHCVAVCPHGALDHAEVPLAGCDPVRKELTIGFEQAAQFLRSRRSVRRFKDQPVERETLGQLIDVARCAPTASNLQLLEWISLEVLINQCLFEEMDLLACAYCVLRITYRTSDVNTEYALRNSLRGSTW